LLFNALPDIIDYLAKKDHLDQPKIRRPSGSESESSDVSSIQSDQPEVRLCGYDGLSLLFDEILFQFFQSQRYDQSLRADLLEKAIDQVVKVTELMSEIDKEQKVVNLVLDCITDEEDEERRLTGIILYDRLGSVLGQRMCSDYILYEYILMQDDSVFKIRREMVLRLPSIAKHLDEKIFVGVIVPVFRKLSQDSIWSVRKACVEILPEMANLSTDEVKNS
jgi:hypothetical protein